GFDAGIDPGKVAMKTVQVDDIKMAYKEFGGGYPLVLIMGYSGTMDIWDPVMLKDLSRRFRVIIFDNRGMGKTAASDKEFTIELFAEDTAHLMEAIGVDRAHVLGYSMGTAIAQELALKYPEKVNKLILYAADCGGAEAIQPEPEVMRRLTDTSGPVNEREERLIKLMLPEKWLNENPDYRKALPRVKETTPAANIDRQTKAMEGWQGCYSRLPMIAQETLLITGTDDVLTPPGNSLILALRIPGAWLVQLEGGGHGVMYQRPKEFARILITFLEHLK
ncbi:MAG: alpha/beta hydrolase, partial [Candidatus Omnitrophica bacterium]|nr:alpha/beta hydrolase [Candidatus Omnitrophota bacterium]